MTKPETELDRLLADAKAKLERMTPEEQAAMFAAQRESWVRGEAGMNETSVMLSASPPAPSVPDVVREWERRVAVPVGPSQVPMLNEWSGLGDRMAAALIEGPNEVIIEGKRYHVADLPMTVASLESKVAAQAKTIEGLEREVQTSCLQAERLARSGRDAEATVTELRAQVLGVREEYALCRTLLMERTAEVERLRGEVERAAIQAENAVWHEVIGRCAKAWGKTAADMHWSQSPLELIRDIIDERDEAAAGATTAESSLVRRHPARTPGEGMKDLIERLENQARDNVLRGYASGLDGEKFIYEKWAASDLQIVAALKAYLHQ